MHRGLLWFVALAVLGTAAAQTCDSHGDCKSGEQCGGLLGNCELPRKWNGERPVYCQTNKHCRDRVGSKSKCDRASGKTGRCARRDDLCRDENELWVERCPRGFYCDSRRYCKRDDRRGGSGSLRGDRDRNRDRDRNGGDGYCSLLNPCRTGRTCCSDGTCSRSRSCTCSRSNSRGSCPLGEECESRGGRGSCRRIRCSRRSSCPEGFECRNGECREDRDYLQSSAIDFPDRRDRDQECSSRNRFGYCPRGEVCRNGRCRLDDRDHDGDHNNRGDDHEFCSRDRDCHNGEECVRSRCRDANRRPCSRSNRHGYCDRSDEYCDRGECVPDRGIGIGGSSSIGFGSSPLQNDRCSRRNRNGLCPRRSEVCENGFCIDDFFGSSNSNARRRDECSSRNRDGYCQFGYVCRRGLCEEDNRYDDRDRCSRRNDNGICQIGYECRRGECVRESECSLNNLDGYCRRRNEMCRDGRCERVTERDRCSEDNYRGFCPHNQECRRGFCEFRRSLGQSSADLHPDFHGSDGPGSTGHYCSYSEPCPAGQVCGPRDECLVVCSSFNPHGYCHPGERCRAGVCEIDRDHHTDHDHDNCVQDRDCHNGQECLRGRCLDLPCSRQSPDGRCPRGRVCDRGVCVRDGARDEDFDNVGPLGGDQFGFASYDEEVDTAFGGQDREGDILLEGGTLVVAAREDKK